MSVPPPENEDLEALAVAKQVTAGVDDIRVPQDLVTELGVPSTGEQEKALWLRIRTMTVGQKVKLAFNGNKDARTVLLRDTNKVIPRLVLQNPRITEEEILMLAKDRNVDDEILRQIAESRVWTRIYAIRVALVENARTPLAKAVPLLPTLGEREIARLAKSKNVSNVLAVQARRLILQGQDRRK